ncbi:AAA family ATPase [Falsiroseomonas selenitidurans]|uniref:AAA family ATPase n=1 Tax=Falsiroseomonas selenitidurans TaxID=2716335 RepID=A0ABX1ECK5_9PROT|nr:AAA family ATPase [Falsiroseomonas selenitidurans]NKC34545.1 AAA family ATPase [Falsiroseomonas selenitidurans]
MSDASFSVIGAQVEDANRGIARLDPAALVALGCRIGDVLAIEGRRTAHARALPLPAALRGAGRIALDGAMRGNAGAAIGEAVAVRAAGAVPRAIRLVLAGPALKPGLLALARVLDGMPLALGDTLRLALPGGREAELRVLSVQPASPALVDAATVVTLDGATPPSSAGAVRYEDLGGLGRVVERIREVVELPLRHRDAFARLGITPPRGVLLVGPPGTGKTLIARAVATESRAAFIAVNGPEIMDRYYGASEGALRAVFERARKEAPAIIFIDELDAIAPRRDGLSGEKQVEKRLVAQLLTLMDGLGGRGDVVVLAATNMADMLDPALRRPGRFDREIRVDPPDEAGRREILAVHSRAMPLDADVDIGQLAALTAGFVGADLAALCREAAIAALRRAGALEAADIAPGLTVTAADFAAALSGIVPSALRETHLEMPRGGWADVAGLDGLRGTLERAVLWPLRHPGAFARMGLRPPRGVLLHGAPGTGKTLLARALAAEAGIAFIAVRGAELLSPWQGTSEAALRRIFDRARQSRPCLVFFDEIDCIAGRRGGADGATVERMVATLLAELDGIADPPGIVVLGATNRVEAMDPALLRPGRFDLVLRMAPPGLAARRAILGLHAGRMPLAADVALDALAEATPGLVGADLAGLCRRAALAAMAEAGNPMAAEVAARHFAAALAGGAEEPS